MDSALMYQGVAHGDVDVVSAFSADGRIAAYDLVILEDDRGVIPPYDAIVLGGPGLVRDRPEALADLGKLAGTIDPDRMRAMSMAVDEDGRTPQHVARELLASIAGHPD